jgi:hypothetical protein
MLFDMEANKVIIAGFNTQEEANNYAFNDYKGDLFFVVVIPYHMLSL